MSTFVIIEEGRAFAPVTIQSESLLVGRSLECGLQLKDPAIPMALAGIKQIGGRHYFLRLKDSPFASPQAPTIFFNEQELLDDTALSSGDEITVEHSRLVFAVEADTLVIRVSYLDEKSLTPSTSKTPHEGSRAADDVMEQWIKRRLFKGRKKVSDEAYLQPTPQKPKAGTEFNWMPTRDLMAPWPIRFLILSLIIIGGAAVLIFFVFPVLLAPGSVSHAHEMDQLSLPTPIATAPNRGACTNCHDRKVATEEKCTQCHKAEGFQASMSDAHKVAGLTCISCHTEHKGKEFSSRAQAFQSCVGCHNDQNKQTYNGRSVHQPHGGTFGYPTRDGKWIWPGLSAAALNLKPEVQAVWSNEYDEQVWRRVQFHSVHLYRVRTTGGIIGIEDGSMSCKSCHKSFDKLDRDTPRQLCAICHNGFLDERTNQMIVEAGKPNCSSCHVEHLYDVYRWGDLLTEPAAAKRKKAIDEKYLEAVKSSAVVR
jgi:hypothetical protein